MQPEGDLRHSCAGGCGLGDALETFVTRLSTFYYRTRKRITK